MLDSGSVAHNLVDTQVSILPSEPQAMENYLRYDAFPSHFYKWGFQEEEEGEEPTSVLELVYNSPPSPSCLHFNRGADIWQHEHVPNGSPLTLTDFDSLLSTELPKDMDLDAILPAVLESVTGENSILQPCCFASCMDGFHLGTNCIDYGDSSEVANCLVKFGCEELPPLNDCDWSGFLDMELQQQQPCEMTLQSLVDPTHIKQVISDPSYGQLLQVARTEPFADQLKFLMQTGEEVSMSHTELLSLLQFNASGSPSFPLEASECSLMATLKRKGDISDMMSTEDECSVIHSLTPNVVRKAVTCFSDESSLMRKKRARGEMTVNEDLTRKQNPYDKVQLLEKVVACAQAVACHDNLQAGVILRQMETMLSPYGDSLQRVASCFAEGLQIRLGLPTSMKFQQERLEWLVYEGCPFIPFGHFATNSMILEAIEGEEVIHVIDFGMESGLQWPALIQSLGYRASGRPLLLRITGVGFSLEKMKAARQELEKAANWVKLPFEFRAVVVQNSLEQLKKGMLGLKAGEAVVMNSVLQFHQLLRESRRGLSSLLKLVHDIAPKILTIVEQEGNHNGPFFLGRFNEALQYYTAIFDSLEATMSRCSSKRAKIEQCYFGEQIKNIVSCEGPARVERHERLDQWRRRMGRAGFQPFCFNLLSLKARIWLARYDYCDDYSLTEDKASLVLGWKGKPIIAASAWRCS